MSSTTRSTSYLSSTLQYVYPNLYHRTHIYITSSRTPLLIHNHLHLHLQNYFFIHFFFDSTLVLKVFSIDFWLNKFSQIFCTNIECIVKCIPVAVFHFIFTTFIIFKWLFIKCKNKRIMPTTVCTYLQSIIVISNKHNPKKKYRHNRKF